MQFITTTSITISATPVAPEAAFSGGAASLSEAGAASLAAKAAGTPVEAATWMVAAANPLAVEAGAAVLADGGSAACRDRTPFERAVPATAPRGPAAQSRGAAVYLRHVRAAIVGHTVRADHAHRIGRIARFASDAGLGRGHRLRLRH